MTGDKPSTTNVPVTIRESYDSLPTPAPPPARETTTVPCDGPGHGRASYDSLPTPPPPPPPPAEK